MSLSVIATTFAVIFPAELPDKSTIAALVLGAKYRPGRVFAGVAAAFTVQVGLAVIAGHFLGLLPGRWLELVVGLLFGLGAWLVWREQAGANEPETADDRPAHRTSFWRAGATSFSVVFIAEFGDLTQIATANLAAKYHDPWSVAVGSTLALWSVAAIAIWGGRRLLRIIPMRLFSRLAAAILAVFAVISLATAIRG